MELGSHDCISDEETLGDGEDIGEISLEYERCGICTDLVIDRGVLDCCDHWFCFPCIDNWAGITNLCPLCKNEFQMITCVPVYDTIGNNKIVEDSLLRDDDWNIQGENNTLSFPSYYIDENAVICLDGDACKIRSRVAVMDVNLPLDTSIACDSCDLWYHAFCVGFDPEATSENSWLCPRCILDQEPSRSDLESIKNPAKVCTERETGQEDLVGATLSGKVSITVADAGETAVVISMVEGEHKIVTCHSSLEGFEPSASIDGRAETLLSKHDTDLLTLAIQKASFQPNMDLHEKPPLSSLGRDVSDCLPNEPLKKANCLSHVPGSNCSSVLLFDQVDLTSKFSESTSNVNCHYGLSLESSSLEDITGSSTAKEQAIGDLHGDIHANNSSLSGGKLIDKRNISEKQITIQKKLEARTMKRKCTEKLSEGYIYKTSDDDTKMEGEIRTKKSRSDGDSNNWKHCPEDSNPQANLTSERNATTPDIMSIVQEADCQSEGSKRLTITGKVGERKDIVSGLRVKKILRRAVEEKNSLPVLQKLRQEIREAIRSKTSRNSNINDIVDEKLLTAFRAAIEGPKNGHMIRSDPSLLKAKKLMLQKGKTRENLTKKIYGTTSGKRRRAWDRDWEVEFWKHRCMSTAPEKVETLKSVLDLLKRSSGSETPFLERSSKGDADNSILSRLYLADTSVFPRKEGIRPVSALVTPQEQIESTEDTSKKIFHPVHENSNMSTPSNSDRGNCNSLSNSIEGNKINLNKVRGGGVSASRVNGSKSFGLPKENPGKSADNRNDKRKWALEVLARKNASSNKSSSKENEEDNSKLKRSYPLLAQLPSDMRPEVIAVCNCKVPTSVRQAQLYRLMELYLKKANMPVIRRTAETELAVADAVNVEKEICEKSNSKLVYLNLCSQVISQHKCERQAKNEVRENEEVPGNCVISCENVEEALKLAGLDSDSPPSSPHVIHTVEENDVHLISSNEKDPENVLDLDSHTEFDIYGDFEYDLDDHEYIGPSEVSSILRPSQLQHEESDTKIKVVLSSVIYENASDTNGVERLSAKNDSLGIGDVNEDSGRSTLDHSSTVECQASCDEKDEELSLADCEELYGADKEPLANRFGSNISVAISAVEDHGPGNENHTENRSFGGASVANESYGGDLTGESVKREETKVIPDKQSDLSYSITKKVEAYVKEHIRPLCKSGVISVEQYRWAVTKTTDKVMKFHGKAKNANFLIKEGDKVKKLAEQYVEAAQEKS